MSLHLKISLVFLPIIAGAALVSTVQAASLCAPAETVVFSCSNGTKYASICASKSISKTEGSMQYRFGMPGKVEMIYPAAPRLAAIDFTGSQQMYSGGGATFLRFSNGAYEYTVFSGIGKWGPHESPAEKSGVFVRKAGKDVSNFICRGAIKDQGELGPDFLENVGITLDNPDADYEIPDAFFKNQE